MPLYYISNQRRAAVDYICVPHDWFNMYDSFRVYTMNELSTKCQIAPLISKHCKIPDHSVLHVKVMMSTPVVNPEVNDQPENLQDDNIYKQRKYRFANTPNLFMANNKWNTAMASVIDMSISCRISQEEIDNLYVNFTQLLLKEMDTYLKYTEAHRITRKRLKTVSHFGMKNCIYYGRN